MMNDDKRPFATLIANYIYFRLALLGNRLTSADLEYNSLVQVIVNGELSAASNHKSNISIASQPNERPLNLRTYLTVFEDENSKLCHVVLHRAVHGANNEHIELDEIWLDGNAAADYLSKFYAFLVTGKWD